MPKSGASSIDRHIAYQLVFARQIRGWTQKQVGDLIDVTPQQIQKYESGDNAITLAKALVLARAFRVPLQWLVERVPD